MTRLAALLFAAFITLHTPSGREVFVNADEIMMIRDGIGCPAMPNTEVTVHDHTICVNETPAQVKQLVEGAK